MVQANELRRFNKVYHEGRIFTVKEVREYDATFLETDAAIEYEDLDAIELSPEILESCGFIKETGDYFKDSVVYSNKIRLYQHDNNDYSLYGFNECKVWVFYLHELQNLFAILTGSELTINLEKVKV